MRITTGIDAPSLVENCGGQLVRSVESRAAPAPAEAELTRFGLALPPIIVLLYARDSSTPLARLELGTAADSFDRYARLAPRGDVVTIAEFEVNRLTELLKAVGAGS